MDIILNDPKKEKKSKDAGAFKNSVQFQPYYFSNKCQKR